MSAGPGEAELGKASGLVSADDGKAGRSDGVTDCYRILGRTRWGECSDVHTVYVVSEICTVLLIWHHNTISVNLALLLGHAHTALTPLRVGHEIQTPPPQYQKPLLMIHPFVLQRRHHQELGLQDLGAHDRECTAGASGCGRDSSDRRAG